MTKKQTQYLYDWERNFVEPHDKGFLSRDECETVVAGACRHLHLKTPRLRFVKSGRSACYADPNKWLISISDWGRTKVTLLHEVAHLATIGAVSRGEDGHGPSFQATIIHLYASFLQIDWRELYRSAISVGLEPDLQLLEMLRSGSGPRASHTSRFEDISF